MSKEFQSKLKKIQDLLEVHSLDALLIQRVTNFAWATCGASSYVHIADSMGVASLLIAPHGRYLITNNIEAPRFEFEEGLLKEGWDFKVVPWYQTTDVINELTKGLRLGTDSYYPGGKDLSEALVQIRMNLLPEEQVRFREVCEASAEAMNNAIRGVMPGMTEYEISAILGSEAQRRGLLPIVNLIATDERVYSFRHPLPTSKRLDRYAMLVLCAKRYGLVASITRLIHFGPMSDELRRKAEAVARIDAAFIAATRPGQTVKNIFKIVQAKYAEVGFPDEWQLHHQGGPAAYLPREMIATPDIDLEVKAGQVYAWNPSITGSKSEDTILVKEEGAEILTDIPGWPSYSIEIDGRIIPRPATLEIVN